MADGKSKHDLPYGHLGRAHCSRDDGRWHFERVLPPSDSVKPLGGHTLHPIERITSSTSHETPGKRHQTQLDQITQRFPQLRHARSMVLPLTCISEAVEEAKNRHDPNKGNLMRLANIRSEATHRMTPVLFSATGEDGSLLRISQVQLQRQGWAEDRASFLDVPVISGDEKIWDAQLGPIQQLCFARATDHSDNLLAIRYLSKTLLVRPIYGSTLSNNVTGSRFRMEVLHTINLHDANGCSHADVTFNPWFALQIACINQRGTWNILEFHSRRLDRLARSWTDSTVGEDASEPRTLHDGWGRIAWIVDAETMIVCGRRSMKLFRIGDCEFALTNTISTDLLGDLDWILDFQRDDDVLDLCYLLTSSYVMVYQFRRAPEGGYSGHIKSKIRHFRDPEDVSLKLTICKDDKRTLVLLYSMFFDVATVYQFSTNNAGELIMTDPCQLPVSFASCSVHDVHIQKIPRSHKQSRSERSEDLHNEKHNEFLSALMLRRDNSISQRLLHAPRNDGNRVVADFQEPSWTMKISSNSSRLRKECFVVDDDDISTTVLTSTMPQSRRIRREMQVIPAARQTQDLELVAETLRRSPGKAQQMEKILEIASTVLAQRQFLAVSSLQVLSGLVEAEIEVTDVQHSTNLLEELFSGAPGRIASAGDNDPQLETANQWRLSDVALPPFLGVENELANGNLKIVYDNIVSRWVTPLPKMNSGWIRLAKVGIARAVAAEITLATKIIVSKDATEYEEEARPPTSQTFDHPGREHAHSSSQPASSDWVAKHFVPPTPSPTATPSTTTASSNYLSLAAPELHRLSKYTSFSMPSPMVLTQPLAKVLSHWLPGTDPKQYDWLSKSKQITRQEEDEADEDLPEKERQRARRRAERHIRRQRKEAAASQARHLASSQAPEILSASQPVDTIVKSQPHNLANSSQSQGFGMHTVASQVAPGRFGGRPAKKKRKIGF